MGEIVDMFSRRRVDSEGLNDFDENASRIAEYGTYVGKLHRDQATFILSSVEELQRINAQLVSLQARYDELYNPYISELKDAYRLLKIEHKLTPNNEPYIDDNGDTWLVETKNIVPFIGELDRLRKRDLDL